MSTYYISIGSNMGDRLRYLVNAVYAIRKAGAQIGRQSSIYETEPWGKTDQTPFLNAVIAAEWDSSPEELLRRLQMIENQFGRVRCEKWGPRTLDIDLIYSDDVSRDTKFLMLPHPWFWLRPFVLIPLGELEPGFTYQGQTIGSRIAELEGNRSVKKWSHQW